MATLIARFPPDLLILIEKDLSRETRKEIKYCGEKFEADYIIMLVEYRNGEAAITRSQPCLEGFRFGLDQSISENVHTRPVQYLVRTIVLRRSVAVL